MRFSTVALGVADLERSIAFYTDGIGFAIASRPQPDLVYLASGETRIALYPADQLAAYAGVEAAPPGGVVLSLNLSSAAEVDAVIARAVSSGGVELRQPGANDWGGHAGSVKDPDGHLWELVWSG